MDLYKTIKYMFPGIDPLKDFKVQDDCDGKGAFIAEWNSDEPKPSDAELQAAWEEYQANPPSEPLTPLEQLQKDQADLTFQLMMKGVL